MQTRQQKRAEEAYSCVSVDITGDKENYVRLAKSFPALVHTCGLVQALAFVRAKDNKENTGATYIQHLSRIIDKKLIGNSKLDEISRTAGLTEYQHLTRETIEAATWLKRYAEALLESD